MPRVFTYPLCAEMRDMRYRHYARSTQFECYLNLNIGKSGRWFISVYFRARNKAFEIRFRPPMSVLKHLLEFRAKHGDRDIKLTKAMRRKLFKRPGEGFLEHVSLDELKRMRPYMLGASYKSALHYISKKHGSRKSRKKEKK